MQNREKQIEEMAITLNEAKFGVNMQTLADHLRPETINKVAEYLYTADYRKQEWISDKERNPKKYDDVLADDKDGDITIDFVLSTGEFCFEKEYTHWMPLPEAPKVKGGAE